MSIRRLPQLGRFLSVGMLNLVGGLLVIYACKWLFDAEDAVANAIGYCAGLISGFTLNSRWTFAYRGPQLSAFFKFLLVALVAYGMNLLTVLILIQQFDVNSYVAQALGIPPYTVTTYIASKFIVFRAQPDKKEQCP